MYQINDDKSIYVTRGDIVLFEVTAEDNGEVYTFQPGDLVRIKVFGKKNCENVVLQKDFPVTAASERVEIFLDENDTKIGEVINKPADYWYEIELNPLSDPQTIVGYNEDGPAIFRLFPEGRDLEADDPVITPEDIPFIDKELDITSKRPVENQAVARALISLEGSLEVHKEDAAKQNSKFVDSFGEMQGEIITERARIDNFVSGATPNDAEVVDLRTSIDGTISDCAGAAVRGQIKALAKSNLKKYRFEYGGITGEDGTLTNNRVRMRTVIPCRNNAFRLTNVALPESATKATAVAYKDGLYVANVYSYVNYTDGYITVTIPEDISVDELGLCFKYGNDSEISTADLANSYIEHYSSAYDIENRIERLNESIFVTKKPIRGVISSSGAFILNTIALSTDFLPCNGSEFMLKGMDGFVLLRCVGLSTDGAYSVIPAKFKDGAFIVAVDGIDSVAFSFYKSVTDGIYADITDEEYESAAYSYLSSLSELSEKIENANKVVEFGVSKLAALGDSITYGFIPRNTVGYPGQLDSYAKLTADYYGMSFENHGISGSTVAIVDGASPMCQRVNDLPNDADVVVFMGGTNDIRKGVSLGTFEDRSGKTFYGALHIVMSSIYKKYIIDSDFGKARKTKIVICTPLKLLDNYYASREGDGILIKLDPWVEAIKEVAKYYSLPVLDFYNLSMINPHINRIVEGYDEGYTGCYNPLITDGTHPTQEGAQLMANLLISFLKCI